MQRVEALDAGPFQIGSTARVKQPQMAEAVWCVQSMTPGQRFSWATRHLACGLSAPRDHSDGKRLHKSPGPGSIGTSRPVAVAADSTVAARPSPRKTADFAIAASS